MAHGPRSIIILLSFLFFPALCLATSDTFPPSASRPMVSDFLPSPNNTYYCSPSGDNSTGDGSIGNPWEDLRGAQGTVAAGDLIYLRGGSYDEYLYANSCDSPNKTNTSCNFLQTNGASGSPIVITNYPGEIAVFGGGAEQSNSYSMSLMGNYQKLIGSMVGSSYGIHFQGGMSVRYSNCQVSNVEFSYGTDNHDANSSMLSVPTNFDNVTNLIISHNYFHDAEDADVDPQRMSCVRFFTSYNSIVEYNLFKDNLDLSTGGAVYFKEGVNDGIVRYNTFVNNTYSIVAVGQQESSDGLHVYKNLSYGDQHFFEFFVEWGDGFRVYQNVVLNLDVDGEFFYFHANGSAYEDSGEFYDNVIDGEGFGDSWGAEDESNLPDLFDYNLWYTSSDQNCSSLYSTCSSSYYDHAIVSDNAVTYNGTTMTATVADDYDGLGKGRYGGNIGGFTFIFGKDPSETTTIGSSDSSGGGCFTQTVWQNGCWLPHD